MFFSLRRLLPPQIQIQVHITLNPGHPAGMRILPQVEVVVEIRLRVILCQPQMIVRQFPQVVAQVAQALVEVDRRTVAGFLNFFAEGGGALRQSLVVQPIGAGVLRM